MTDRPECGTDDVVVIDETIPLIATDNTAKSPSVQSQRRFVVALALVIIFFLEISLGLISPGLIAVLEQRICYDMSSASTTVMDCKGIDVQSKLAYIRGWTATIECIPGIFATVPYGMLSDRIGRPKVLTLAISGMILTITAELIIISAKDMISIEWIMLAALFGLIGGGAGVVMAMIFTTVADVVPAEARAAVFLQFTTLTIISDLICGPLAGFILLKSNWAVCFLSVGLLVLSAIASLFFPNTVELAQAAGRNSNGVVGSESAEGTGISSILQETTKKVRLGLRELGTFLRGKGTLIAMLTAVVTTGLSRLVQEILLQYTTRRYNWSWSHASFVLTIRSIFSLVILMVVLPVLDRYLVTRTKLTAINKDVWVSRFMGIFGVAGSIMIGLAATPVALIAGLCILAFNMGMGSVMRSVVNAMVDPHHLGTLNSFIAVLELTGAMIAAPALFGTFSLGMKLGNAWLGLPFFCAAGLLLISTVILSVVPFKSYKTEEQSSDDNLNGEA